MKIISWNVNKNIDNKKKTYIKKLLDEKKPEIFTIIEGTPYEKDCVRLNSFIKNCGYYEYYTPLFYHDKNLNLRYPFISNGLKIFLKNGFKTNVFPGFTHERANGRIIILEHKYLGKDLTFIFIHNYAKSGNREVIGEQNAFFGNITSLIKYAQLPIDINNTIIIGDFNVEPWDTTIRNKRILNSYFFDKQYNLELRKNRRVDNPKFYNPVFDYIIQNQEANLCGTYHKNTLGWALLDYALFFDKKNIQYEILYDNFLETDNAKKEDFINSGFDHLPIMLKI